MSYSRKSKKPFWKTTKGMFWLLWSISSTILFSFGLLALLNNTGSWIPVAVGAFMMIVAVITKNFTTETAYAMKKGKR